MNERVRGGRYWIHGNDIGDDAREEIELIRNVKGWALEHTDTHWAGRMDSAEFRLRKDTYLRAKVIKEELAATGKSPWVVDDASVEAMGEDPEAIRYYNDAAAEEEREAENPIPLGLRSRFSNK